MALLTFPSARSDCISMKKVSSTRYCHSHFHSVKLLKMYSFLGLPNQAPERSADILCHEVRASLGLPSSDLVGDVHASVTRVLSRRKWTPIKTHPPVR